MKKMLYVMPAALISLFALAEVAKASYPTGTTMTTTTTSIGAYNYALSSDVTGGGSNNGGGNNGGGNGGGTTPVSPITPNMVVSADGLTYNQLSLDLQNYFIDNYLDNVNFVVQELYLYSNSVQSCPDAMMLDENDSGRSCVPKLVNK